MIIETESGGVTNFLRETEQVFMSEFDENFLVLPDEKTIVGRDASDPKKLVLEDITRNHPIEVAKHRNYINTPLYDPETETLLVGDDTGKVVQYVKEAGGITLLTTDTWEWDGSSLRPRWGTSPFSEATIPAK